ncbi:MAG TPA: Hpt domain-containing protein, partial [Myxococcota bacterium]
MAARRTRPSARSKAAREFVSEVEELLDRMRADLTDLGDQRAAGELEPELVNRLFRSAHTLKGVAGMFGFEGIGALAHRLEDVLDDLRMGRLPPSAPALDLLDEAVAVLTAEVEAAGRGEARPEGGPELGALIERIAAALQSGAAGGADPALPALDPTLLRALTEYEEHRLRENLRRGRAIYLVEAAFELLAFEEGLAELSEAARSLGELISTLPAPGDQPEAQIRFSLLVASDHPPDAFEQRLDLP